MKKLLAFVFVISMLSAMAFAASPFKDVSESEWYYSDVNTAYEMGLINGKNSPETFLPNDNMTYAEAIKLAACMHQRHNTGSVTLVNGEPWYQTYADYCKKNGIINGEINYNENITRAAYMEIFSKALPASALEAKNNIEMNSIPDVSDKAEHADAIYTLYRAGVVGGVDEKHSCAPETNIKRSEVATILVRMMDESKRVSFTMKKASATNPEEPKADAKENDIKKLIEQFLADFTYEPTVEEPEKDNTPLTGIKIPYQYDLSPYITIEESDYKGIKLTPVTVEVTAEEMESAVMEDLAKFCETVNVIARGAKIGDYMSINFEGFVGGVAFEGGKAENYEIVLGEAGFIPGFEEQLVGHKSGEEFTIDVTFPDNYAENLAGKKAQFKIKINSITVRIPPELTDDFVRTRLDHKTVNEYFAAVYTEIYNKNRLAADTETKNSVYGIIRKNITINKLPDDMFNYYVDRINGDNEKIAKDYGMTLDELLEASGMTKEYLDKYIKDQATAIVEQELVAFAIAKNEGLLEGVTVGEFEAYIEGLAVTYGMTVEEFKAAYPRDMIFSSLVLEKAIQFVIDHADSGEEKPASPKPSTPKDDDLVTEPEDDDDTNSSFDVEYKTDYTPEALEAKEAVDGYVNAMITFDAEKLAEYVEGGKDSEAVNLFSFDSLVNMLVESGLTSKEAAETAIKPLYDAAIEVYSESTYTVNGFAKSEDGYNFSITLNTIKVDIDAISEKYSTQEALNPILEELLLSGKITESTTQEEAVTMLLEVLCSKMAEDILAEKTSGERVDETIVVPVKKVGDKWVVSEN